MTAETPTAPATVDPADIPAIRGALTRYRVMAYVVGILLVVLVCVGLPLKYIWSDGRVVTWTGMPHGWLYMILLITAYDLGRRVKWSIKWFLLIMAAGTVPFLSFVAEHFATKNVRATIAASQATVGQ
jgi:integral membrane protein